MLFAVVWHVCCAYMIWNQAGVEVASTGLPNLGGVALGMSFKMGVMHSRCTLRSPLTTCFGVWALRPMTIHPNAADRGKHYVLCQPG